MSAKSDEGDWDSKTWDNSIPMRFLEHSNYRLCQSEN